MADIPFGMHPWGVFPVASQPESAATKPQRKRLTLYAFEHALHVLNAL